MKDHKSKIRSGNDKVNLIDKNVVTVIAVLILSVSLFLLPNTASTFFISTADSTIENLSALYICFALFVVCWLLYLIFGKYGNIKLGEQRQFSNIKWISMLFSVGVGSSIFYSAIIDWAYIVPMLSTQHNTPNTDAISYGFLHWGPITWGICAALAVPIAIKKYLTTQPHNNLSDCILPTTLNNSAYAKIIDSFTMFGLLCGASTTLTIGILLISTCIAEWFNITNDSNLKNIVFVLITLSFSTSASLGLQRGMARLSTLGISVSFAMLLAVIIAGPSNAIINNVVNITQQTIANSIQFIQSINPLSPAEITKSWTIFYWAWWALYVPFMSLFIAKISSGRTIRQMLLAATVCSSISCGAFYLILGGFALELHDRQLLDIISTSKLAEPEQLITLVMGLLPNPKIWYALLAFCSSILLITTFDAISVSLASSGCNHLKQSHNPSTKNKLFWTFIIGIMPFTIINLNGNLGLIKAIAIIASLPIMLLIFSGIVAFILKRNVIYQAIRAGDTYEMR